jgi:hypothetical protein
MLNTMSAETKARLTCFLRACFKNIRGPVFAQKALWRGVTRKHPPSGAVAVRKHPGAKPGEAANLPADGSPPKHGTRNGISV